MGITAILLASAFHPVRAQEGLSIQTLIRCRNADQFGLKAPALRIENLDDFPRRSTVQIFNLQTGNNARFEIDDIKDDFLRMRENNGYRIDIHAPNGSIVATTSILPHAGCRSEPMV